MCQVNGKAKNLTPHNSHIFQPIFLKLVTKKAIWDTYNSTQNLVDVGRQEEGLRKWRILAYFYFSILLSIICILRLESRSHRSRPVRAQDACLCARKCLLGVTMIKVKFRGQNSSKTWFWGLHRHFKPNLQNFTSRYLQKYKLDQHEIWRASLEQ